jgi:hypothetical protein
MAKPATHVPVFVLSGQEPDSPRGRKEASDTKERTFGCRRDFSAAPDSKKSTKILTDGGKK